MAQSCGLVGNGNVSENSKIDEIRKAVTMIDHHLSQVQFAIGDLNNLIPHFSALSRENQGLPEGRALMRLEKLLNDCLDAVSKRGYISFELRKSGVL